MIQHLGALIGCLFCSLQKSGKNPTGDCFHMYFIPLVEIKDFNPLAHNKSFFKTSIKNKQEAYEKLVKMLRNNGYTAGKLLNYFYHQKY